MKRTYQRLCQDEARVVAAAAAQERSQTVESSRKQQNTSLWITKGFPGLGITCASRNKFSSSSCFSHNLLLAPYSEAAGCGESLSSYRGMQAEAGVLLLSISLRCSDERFRYSRIRKGRRLRSRAIIVAMLHSHVQD
jgi:hypothetical protein